jgi:hypothetical protein
MSGIWRYQIMRRVNADGDDEYGFYEVFPPFRKDGSVGGWTHNGPCEPTGESVDALREDYASMVLAFSLPVLDYKTGRKIRE